MNKLISVVVFTFVLAYSIEAKSLSKLDQKEVSLHTKRAGFKGTRVSLNFDKVPIGLLIHSILKKSGMSYIMSSKIKGTCSVSLNKVPWKEALSDVLDTHNLTWITVGNTIIILTLKDRDNFTYDFLKQMEYLAKTTKAVLNINFLKTPLDKALSSLVNAGTKDMILTPKAKGFVTANFKNTSWRLAFELIVRLNYLNCYESNNQLLVLTQKNMFRLYQERLIKYNGLK